MLLAAELVGRDVALKVLFRGRGEKQRIDIADAIIRAVMKGTALETHYCETIGGMNHCRKIRNQYAHCHWLYFDPEGLLFTDLNKAAEFPAEDQRNAQHASGVRIARFTCREWRNLNRCAPFPP